MKPETIQALTEQSEALLNTASLLPNPFIDKETLRRSADSRERMLRDEERMANYRAEEERKKAAWTVWATEVHCRLTPLLASLKEYRATVENHEGRLVVRAPGWDKWKDAENDFHGILATVEPIRSYTSHNKTSVWHKQDETHEGNFVNVTIAGKTSRHTKPSFGKIADSLVQAAQDNFDFIERRKQEVAERKAKASKAIETFGAILPLREKTEAHTSGSNPRTRSVYHTQHTYIEPKGHLSGGEISETSNGWTLRLSLSGLDEATAKNILTILAGKL